MSDKVVACTIPGDAERLRWLDGGAWRSGSWTAFRDALGARPWVMLVDGRETTQMALELPVNDVATARRAAPFAIEEQLAMAVEDAAVALAPRGGGNFAAAIADGARIEALRERITALGLHPSRVVPDACALPPPADGIQVADLGDSLLLRFGIGGGLRVNPAALPEIITQLRHQFPETRSVTIHGASGDAPPDDHFAGLEIRRSSDAPAALFFDNASKDTAPAFFDASVRAQSGRRARQLWLAAATAAGALLLAYPAVLFFANQELGAAIARVESENRTLVQREFPEITRLVNPRVQAEQALAQLRKRAELGPRFLDLLAGFEAAFDGPATTNAALRTITFSNGVLEIGVRTSDMAGLENLRQLLSDAGLGAQMLSAESGEEGVNARLRVTRSSSSGNAGGRS